jgi:hypothetical protein
MVVDMARFIVPSVNSGNNLYNCPDLSRDWKVRIKINTGEAS